MHFNKAQDMNWVERLKRWVVPTPAAATVIPCVEPGLYHYQREREGGYQRLHLRVDPSGEGLLIASASEIVRLSQAGVIAAKGLLEGKPAAEVAARLMEMAWEAGADGISLECVDYGNYQAATRERMRALSEGQCKWVRPDR